MSSQTSLQGGATYQAYIQQNPTLLQEPPEVQADVALQYFNSRMEKQAGWTEEPPEIKEQAWQQFKAKHNIPEVRSAHPSASSQPVQPPQWLQQLPDELGYAAATTALPFATAGKALSLDYFDLEKPILDYARGIEQKYPEDFQNDPRRVDSPYSQAGRGISYGAGALKNAQFLEGGLNKGLQWAGRNLIGKARLAEAAGVGASPMVKNLQNATAYLQSRNLGAQAARGAAAFGAYEGLKSNPENQFDIGARVQDAAGGALAAAAFPPLTAGAGKILKGGIQATRNLFQDSSAQVGFGKAASAASAAGKQRLYETFKLLADTVRKIQTGEIDRELVDPQDYAALVQGLDYVGNALKTGKLPKSPGFARGLAHRIQGKARIRAQKVGRSVSVAKPTPAKTAATSEPQAPIEGKSEGQPEQKAASALKGSVQEMVRQVEKEAGFPENAGSSTAGQLEKQIGRKLNTEEKDIHANLRAIARSEAVDADKGIFRQLDPGLSKYDDTADLIEDKKVGEALRDTAEAGESLRLEYLAEIFGGSGEEAVLTKAGNVKPERTTFTPIGFLKTSKGQPMVRGYNDTGHLVSYHINKSAEGSRIAEVGKQVKEAFRGEYGSVYRGNLTFKAQDALKRGARGELTKTSEAIKMMEEVANNLDKVLKLADDTRTPAFAKKILKELRDTTKWAPKDVKKLQMLVNKKEFRRSVCDILGLTHG